MKPLLGLRVRAPLVGWTPERSPSPQSSLLGLVVEQRQHVFPREGRGTHALAA